MQILVVTMSKQQSNNNPSANVTEEAEAIIDDLFADLEVETEATARSARSATASLPAVVKPNSIDRVYASSAQLYQAFIESETIQPEQPQKSRTNHLDKIFFVSSLLFLTGVIVWLYSQEKLTILPAFQPTTPTVAIDTEKLAQDAEFADYMQRSLTAIANTKKHQAEPAKTTKTAEVTPKVIERIYVPVYQPQPQPTAAVYSPVRSSGVRVPATGALPPPPPPLRLPTAQIPTQSPQSPPAIAASEVATAPAPTPSHTLVGSLDLGDRSAALFEINGNTQRIWVGEQIGNSSWKLVSVHNEKVVISNNGRERNVQVGEKF